MYLHLGSNVTIPAGDIVGIFDLDNTTTARHTRAFLRQAEAQGQVVSAGDELPKAFILTSDFGRICLTQFSAATLEKRLAGLGQG